MGRYPSEEKLDEWGVGVAILGGLQLVAAVIIAFVWEYAPILTRAVIVGLGVNCLVVGLFLKALLNAGAEAVRVLKHSADLPYSGKIGKDSEKWS